MTLSFYKPGMPSVLYTDLVSSTATVNAHADLSQAGHNGLGVAFPIGPAAEAARAAAFAVVPRRERAASAAALNAWRGRRTTGARPAANSSGQGASGG